MPRNVRNFWIEADVDGKKQSVATGPRRKDGGFDMTILMRDDGEVSRQKYLTILGRVNQTTGELKLHVTAHGVEDDVPELTIKGKR